MLQVKLMPCAQTLNESPSEKEGKCLCYRAYPRWYRPSMKVPPKRKGNRASHTRCRWNPPPSMKVPPKRKGNQLGPKTKTDILKALNESPSEKEGKYITGRYFVRVVPPSMKVPPKRKGNFQGKRQTGGGCFGPSMKVPPKRKGNSYPKIARNHAAETGASREPRGGYTQNYTLQPHLPPHNSLAREETMRATRHVPVTYQVLAHTKTPAGCFLSDPARVLTYERGWRGSGKPD